MHACFAAALGCLDLSCVCSDRPLDLCSRFDEWFPSAVKSNKVVCFISADYLKSPFCMKEFGSEPCTHPLFTFPFLDSPDRPS